MSLSTMQSMGLAKWMDMYELNMEALGLRQQALKREVLANIAASSLKSQKINLFFFGPTGHGKSSSANSLLGSEAFPVSTRTGVQKTTTVSACKTIFDDYKLKVVDCPSVPRKNPDNERELEKACASIMPQILKICPSGFHAPIFVLKFGSHFVPEDEFGMAMLQHVLGKGFVFQHGICLITHGDRFDTDMKKSRIPKDFDTWCREEKNVLGKIFKACNYRCVLFDNSLKNRALQKKQVQKLIDLVVHSWPVVSKIILSLSPQLRTKADICLVIECASSIGDFHKQLNCAVKYCEDFPIDSGAVRVNMLVVGNNDHVIVNFESTIGQKNLKKALTEAPYLQASTGTDYALTVAKPKMLGNSSGKRSDSKQMAVLFTEGQSRDEKRALQEANEIKRSGTTIMAVGVGCVDRRNIEQLVSEPENAFIADDYEELEDIITEMKNRTCEKAPQYKSVADILFILDSSGSIGDNDYKKELDFVVQVTECFNIGPKDVRFGAMIFSNSTEMLFDFNLTSHSDIKNITMKANYMCGGTDTANALDEATSKFSFCREENRKNIAIVITDGQSNDFHETALAAERLYDRGILVVAVGVGSAVRSELVAIATAPKDVFYVDNYNVLKDIQENLAEKMSSFGMLTETATRSNRPRIPRRGEENWNLGRPQVPRMLQQTVDFFERPSQESCIMS